MNSGGEKELLRAVCWAHTAVCLFPESARGPVGPAALGRDFLPAGDRGSPFVTEHV